MINNAMMRMMELFHGFSMGKSLRSLPMMRMMEIFRGFSIGESFLVVQFFFGLSSFVLLEASNKVYREN